MPILQKMSQDELIDWIKSIPEDESFTSIVKDKIVSGIKEYKETKGSAVTGEDIFDADEYEDVQDLIIGCEKKWAKSLWRKIDAKKSEDVADNTPEGGSTAESQGSGPFVLRIQAIRAQPYLIKDVTRNTRIKDVKAKFLAEFGDQQRADLYRGNLGKLSNDDKIDIKKGGDNMDDNSTLGDYGIVNGVHLPLLVQFRVKGGADAKYNDNDDDDDKYRARKIRKKKLKKQGINLKYSSKPDCIMGYNDSDGIPRAEMPCNCSFAADTMYRFMKSIFEKDMKSTKAICPMPKGTHCKGNDKQRLWDWGLVFIISDLSDKEVAYYTKCIDNRVSGSKNCPHCGAVTTRPEQVGITRVRCVAKGCPGGGDWCFNCGKKWKHHSLGPICGNNNCMADQINACLASCKEQDTPWSNVKKNGQSKFKMPTIRACPKCLTTLQYVKACKHIECPCCPHQFCFNCLKDWNTVNKNVDQHCHLGITCEFKESPKY